MTVLLDEVRQFLKKKVGLDVDGVRDEQLERRITNYCRRHRVADDELIATLSDEATLDRFLDSLTINVTSLFRNAERWERIAEILPSLGPRPELWSAACSKGAEPYTMAMIADRLDIKPNILATDIDTRILAAAVEGVYTAQEVKEVPRNYAKAYLSEVDGQYHVARSIASTVKFERGDLLAGPLPRKKFDLIACRNVAIYFSQDAKRLLHANLAGCLKPGGYLFIGSTERVDGPGDLGLRAVSPFIYQLDAETVGSKS
ncbi:MAG: protein-glutamate O-methyltransferase CheR [Actinomycetota bacterium]